MAITSADLRQILITKFPDALINIVDYAGDADHYSVEITSSAFQGKSILQQHRLVKNALSDALQNKLHAVTIKTYPAAN